MSDAQLDLEKLGKVLALAASDKPGEALAALRAAQGMLNRAGLRLQDLVAVETAGVPAPSLRRGSNPLEHRVVILEGALRDAHLEVAKWNRAASAADADGRRHAGRLMLKIARLERELLVARVRARQTASERRRRVIERLRDPATAGWSDRAIARSAGVSPQTVTNWRHRLSAEAGGKPAPIRTVQRRGRTYRMNTQAIGRRNGRSLA